MWDKYCYLIRYFVMIPYWVQLCLGSCFYYYEIDSTEKGVESSSYITLVGSVFILFQAFFFYFEVVSISRQGWHYFKDGFNYFDFTSIPLNFLISFNQML